MQLRVYALKMQVSSPKMCSKYFRICTKSKLVRFDLPRPGEKILTHYQTRIPTSIYSTFEVFSKSDIAQSQYTHITSSMSITTNALQTEALYLHVPFLYI